MLGILSHLKTLWYFQRIGSTSPLMVVGGARADSWPVQIHRTSAAGCTSDAAEEASRTAATTSGRQPIPSHLHHHFGACQSVTFGAHVRLVSGSDVPPCWMYPGAVRAPPGVVFAAWRRRLLLGARQQPMELSQQSTSVTRRQRPESCTSGAAPTWPRCTSRIYQRITETPLWCCG